MMRSISFVVAACASAIPVIGWAQANVATSAPGAANTPVAAQAPVTSEQLVRPGTDVRAGRSTTVINAPFDSVAAVVADFPHYREFLPQVAESRVIQRRRGEVDVYFRVPLLDNLGIIWSLVRFRVTRTPTSLVADGQQVQGNMRRFEYHIEAHEIAGTATSRVIVEMLAVPALPLPASYLSPQQTRWGGRGLVALRARAERTAGLAAINPRRNIPPTGSAAGPATNPPQSTLPPRRSD